MATGITRDEIRQRLRTGSLIPVYRGVYRVGHGAPGLESDYMAAVRACGEGAVLGDRAAGHLSLPAPRTPARSRGDRADRREARARGDEFRRYTYGDVLEEPTLMLDELRALIYGSTRPRRIA